MKNKEKNMHKKEHPAIIIDGSLYLYTSYYGFRNFNYSTEKPSNAIYGILKMINSILRKYYNSKKIVIVFDSQKITFRKKMFKEYKSNRSPMPASLAIQIPSLFKILHKIGIKVLSIPGIEADDIIGSLSCRLENKGEKVLIVSHDKDMIQLVTKNINILHKKNNYIITPETIKKKYGIRPKEFIDVLSLMGDTADNIPGVPQIGIKTALFLLNKFSNINNIYDNIEKIPFLPIRNAKKIAVQLQNYKKIVFFSYKLAQIQLDIPINITLKEIVIKKNCIQNLFHFLKKMTSDGL